MGVLTNCYPDDDVPNTYLPNILISFRNKIVLNFLFGRLAYDYNAKLMLI